MIEIAQKYHDLGFCVVPASNQKRPIGKWKSLQGERVAPNGQFLYAEKMGIVCGKVSGNLEVMDFDLKYDLTGDLFERFKKELNAINPEILKKMVVQSTQNKGFHFFYLCDKIEGNQPLARRPATEKEMTEDKERVKVLIETRGEGGFIMTYPSEGYGWHYRDLSQISRITTEERETLFGCARAFNEVFEKQITTKEYTSSHTVFDEWNQRGDIESLLLDYGWTFKGNCNGNRMYLRPNGDKEWSAGYHPDTRLFRVFTTSTEFNNDTTYNPSQVLAYMKFDKNYAETAKWLQENGYGVENIASEVKINDDYSFVASDEEQDSYIEKIRNGTFQMGLTTGFAGLDKHLLFKPAQLNLCLGHDNVGKSVFTWWLAMQSAKLHKWNWIIWSGENKVGGIKRKIIEYYYGQKINDLTETQVNIGKEWFQEHFTIINNDSIYSHRDMLKMGEKLLKRKRYDYFMIDPYNGLIKETENEHQYDYKAMLEFRNFNKNTGCGIHLNVHAITEALRKRYPKGHELENHPMRPHKADAEGGAKFCAKADDFIVAHRMTQHPDLWMNMEIHVDKIKETESGGSQTVLDKPIILKMKRWGIGYEEIGDHKQESIDYTESKKEETDEPPF